MEQIPNRGGRNTRSSPSTHHSWGRPRMIFDRRFKPNALTATSSNSNGDSCGLIDPLQRRRRRRSTLSGACASPP
jgi:hypothetical protein